MQEKELGKIVNRLRVRARKSEETYGGEMLIQDYNRESIELRKASSRMY